MIILRVDIDMPYGCVSENIIGLDRSSVSDRARDYMYENGEYYHSFDRLCELLERHDTSCTVFLSDLWLPPKGISDNLAKHDIGLHVSSVDKGKIYTVKRKLEKKYNRTINKFSVHDCALSEKHRGWFVGMLMLDSEFDLFSDNIPIRTYDHFYLKANKSGSVWVQGMGLTRQNMPPYSMDMKWVMRNHENLDIVVCTHPCELDGKLEGAEKTKENLITILENCHVVSFHEWRKERDI